MLAIIVAVQLARSAIDPQLGAAVLAWFAFIPARYVGIAGYLPGGLPADAWTFVTYALLHGSWVHLITNAVWLVAFGSAVARRFGAVRFWVFSAAAAAGGAAMHLAVHFGDPVPVVGASAAIAGLMAAAARFVFDSGGPLVLRRPGDDAAFRRPARTLRQTLQTRSALVFIVLWFVINAIVGIGSTMAGGLSIAWEAHVGGFLVGLLLFRLFDPVPR
ncbi:rhomboid family intramembrane serine protease [Acuticoccus sp.]|uniref:rhomboid family intramembrane serine protease n=1 Tax=Acuticoccus sp. TaxID=1904378 RepID=UPI003B52E8CD